MSSLVRELTAPLRALFATRQVQPPSALYISRTDVLGITSQCSLAGVTLELRGRLLTPRNDVVPFRYFHATEPDRANRAEVFEAEEGYLLGLIVFPTSSTVPPGAVSCAVYIGRGSVSTGLFLHRLAQGSPYGAQPVSWPAGRFSHSVQVPPRLYVVTGTDPAAGAEISETVPSNARWRLLSMRAPFTTSAVVGNREPRLVLDDGAAIYYVATPTNTLPASTGGGVNVSAPSFRPDVIGVGPELHLPLDPRIILSAGHRLRTVTVGLDAGDNYSAPIMLVEEWMV